MAATAVGNVAHVEAQSTAAARVHLQWSRPAGSTCIEQHTLEQRVEALLDQPVFVAEDRATLRIVGNVQQRAGGWVATVQILEPRAHSQGVRQLRQDSSDCAALSPALTVVLATLIALAQPESSAQQSIAIALGAAGAFALRVLPESTPGASLWLGLVPDATWSVWLDTSLWLPVEIRDARGRGARFGAWLAGLSLCRDFRAGERWVFGACAGGQLGAIDGEGRGLAPNRSSQRMRASGSVDAQLSLRLFSAVALHASATGALCLTRPTFFLEQPDGTHSDLFRSPSLSFLLKLGVIVEIR